MPILTLRELRLEEIVPNPQGREPDAALIDSMRQYGLLIPVDVRAAEDGRYALIEGHQRLGGARQLGWRSLAAVIEPADAAGLPAELKSILINLRRETLQHLHLARLCRTLLEREGWSQAEVARRIGRHRSAVSQMQKVLSCTALVAAIEAEGLEFGAARALAFLLPSAQMSLLADLRAIAEKEGKFPPVRWVEARVREARGQALPVTGLPPERLAEVVAALRNAGAVVTLRGPRGGQRRLEIALAVAEADVLRLELPESPRARRTAAAAG